MKKSAVMILLMLTVAFTFFIGGFYIGKNFHRSTIEVISTQATLPITSINAAPNSTALPSAPTQNKRVNINTATLEELDSLYGIGPVLAQAIIDYRTEHGLFRKPEDLLNVSGIGPKTLEKIIDQITVGG